jgi:hypothetical protein
MHGVLHIILMLQYGSIVDYKLPSLETLHSTTIKKKAFAYSQMLPYISSHGT